MAKEIKSSKPSSNTPTTVTTTVNNVTTATTTTTASPGAAGASGGVTGTGGAGAGNTQPGVLITPNTQSPLTRTIKTPVPQNTVNTSTSNSSTATNGYNAVKNTPNKDLGISFAFAFLLPRAEFHRIFFTKENF